MRWMVKSERTQRGIGRATRWLLPCIALAALTAVLFAWALENLGGYLIPEDSDYTAHYASNGGMWARFDCFGGRAFRVFAPHKSPEEVKQSYENDPDVTPAEPPAFAIIPGRDDREGATILRGWPAVCLYHTACGAEGKGVRTRLIADIPVRGNLLRLPFGVYWPGMIADVAFYAPFLIALRLGARARRRSRRRRAGRCPSCNYDRRGLAADAKCPECGALP